MDASPKDEEALFREARRRRHLRVARNLGVIVLAAALVALGLELSSHGHGSPPESSRHQDKGSKTAAATRPGGRSVLESAPMLMNIMGVGGPGVMWGANVYALYADTGQPDAWRTVTPPNMVNVSVSERIGALDAVGPNDLWLPILDVPGLATSLVEGSSRGEGIDYSTDGGRSWSFVALPGCEQACGANLSVSFVDSVHGYASIGAGPTSPSFLYSTDDGGASWTRIGTMPDLGGIIVGGPQADRQIEFTSLLDGWEMTGLTSGPGGVTTSQGGVLYRTFDGGQSWTRTSGLPAKNQYSLPTFFGSQDAVVVSNPMSSRSSQTSIFTTDDAGVTWTQHRPPAMPPLANPYSAPGLGLRFAAISPSVWKLYTGSRLYVTTDAGRQWKWSVPRPELEPGAVSAVSFSSNEEGIAISQTSACPSKVAVGQSEPANCYPSLTMTTDGGARWVPVHL